MDDALLRKIEIDEVLFFIFYIRQALGNPSLPSRNPSVHVLFLAVLRIGVCVRSWGWVGNRIIVADEQLIKLIVMIWVTPCRTENSLMIWSLGTKCSRKLNFSGLVNSPWKSMNIMSVELLWQNYCTGGDHSRMLGEVRLGVLRLVLFLLHNNI